MEQLTVARKRAGQLSSQIAALEARRRETETKLAAEHAAHRTATAKRAEFVEDLNGADEATTGWAHGEIDACDAALRVAERMAESLEKALSKIIKEIETLSAEFHEAERVVAQQEREENLRVFKIEYAKALARAGEYLDSARSALNGLNLLEQEAVEKCGGPAQGFVREILQEFHTGQHNPERHGWRRRIPNHGNFGYMIAPMVKD